MLNFPDLIVQIVSIFFLILVVDVEGNLMKIKYDRVFPLEQKLKYSCADVHWSGFVNSLKEIYSKIHDVTLK